VTRFLKPIDLALIIYLFLLSLYISLFHSNIDGYPYQLLFNLSVLVVVLGISYIDFRAMTSLSAFLHIFYPILLLGSLYEQTHTLNLAVFSHPLDSIIIGWEESIFGMQPSVEFFEHFPYPVVYEYFYFAYFSYFLLVGLTPLIFWFLGRRRISEEVVFVMTSSFLVCYLIFSIFPFYGPRLMLPGANQFPLGGIFVFSRFIKFIYDNVAIHGAAFPSSHVVASTVLMLFYHRYLKKVAPLVTVVVISLILATFYCRFHYALDAICGFFLGLLFFGIFRRLFRLWYNRLEK